MAEPQPKLLSRRDFIKLAGAITGAILLPERRVMAAGTSLADRLQKLPVGGFIMGDALNSNNGLIDRSLSADERLRMAIELAQVVNSDEDGRYSVFGRVWNPNNPKVLAFEAGSFDYFFVKRITNPEINEDGVLVYNEVTTNDGVRMSLSAKDLLLAKPENGNLEGLRKNFPQLPDDLTELRPQFKYKLKGN